MVGLHGFSETPAPPDTSFSMQMIDDWGIDDVMAYGPGSRLAARPGPGGALRSGRPRPCLRPRSERFPGGLDVRRLLRAARSCGRRPEVAAAGFVKAGSELNLVHAVLSFCAGLAGR